MSDKNRITKPALVFFSFFSFVPLIVLLWFSGFRLNPNITNLYIVEAIVPLVTILLFWRRFYITSILTVIGMFILIWVGPYGGVVITAMFLAGLLLDAILFVFRSVGKKTESKH